MENKEPIKNPLDFVLDNTDEKPSADAMDDYYQKTEEALGQFMFLLFIPNSHTRTVEVYIDKGEYHTWYTIEEFGEKIKAICGVTAFLYDRVKGTLVEIKEKPQKQRLSVNTIKDLGGFGHVEAPAYGTNSVFESVKGQYLDLVNNLMKGEINGNT